MISPVVELIEYWYASNGEKEEASFLKNLPWDLMCSPR